MEKKQFEKAVKIHRAIVKGAEQAGMPLNSDRKISLMMLLDYECTAEQVEDMAAFIDWCKNNDQSDMYISGNLFHDITGIANREPWFSPRTSGYSKKNIAING